jgi:hypothetical protein
MRGVPPFTVVSSGFIIPKTNDEELCVSFGKWGKEANQLYFMPPTSTNILCLLFQKTKKKEGTHTQKPLCLGGL